ncbi:hypothetical protein BDF21DRAFT_474993 [Thamnidium elegans]|nr:hypothetical protein BDF21DRAFT_474993 [Thamnidium elegans]
MSTRLLVVNLERLIAPKAKRVAYSTCSIHPKENEHVVKIILKRHSDFKLATRESVLPTSNRRGIPEEIHGNKDLAECVAHTVPAEDFFVACFIIKSPNEQGAKRPLEEDNNLDAPTQNFAKKKKKKKAALTQ